MNKKKKTTFTSAVSWSFLDQILLFLVKLIITAFLARLIPPSEFGLLAMVTVITGFLGIFKNVGLNESLIQKKDLTDKDTNTVFWFTLSVSLFLTLIIFISAPFISRFYDNPRLTSITYAMGGLFFLNTLGSIPDALIRKELLFKSFFFRNLFNKLLSGITGIGLAYAGYGIWALIISQYVSVVFIIWVSFKIIRWRPKLFFDKKILIQHLHFGLPLLGLKIFYYWSSNIDTLLIGKKLGDQTLGYYNKAYALMTMPVNKISMSVSRVIFPMFSQIQNNLEEIWKKYLMLLSVTAYITFPLMGGMYLLADVIILTVYGPNWKPAIEIFKGFAFIGAIQSLTYSGTIFQSIGKTKIVFFLNIFLKSLIIIAIIIGLYLKGIFGVIFGYTLGSLVSFLINVQFLSKEFNHSIFEVLKAISKEFLLTLSIVTFLHFIINYLHIDNYLYKSFLVLLVGTSLYLFISKKFKFIGFFFIREKFKKYSKK